MRLLVVTNCRAQAALEVVWQQGQASGRAPGGLEERGVMVSCPSEPGSARPRGRGGGVCGHSSLLFPAQQRELCSVPCDKKYTHTQSPQTPRWPLRLDTPWAMGAPSLGHSSLGRNKRPGSRALQLGTPSSGTSALASVCCCASGSFSGFPRPNHRFLTGS